MRQGLLLSVHLPKCAGSSFKAWLESVYPKEQILYDYADRPIDPAAPMNVAPDEFLTACWSRSLPPGVRVVHGHFWIRKFDTIADAVRITFLRHPVARTLSHYFFWLELPRHGHSLHDRVLDERMTVLEFAALPQIRGFYRDFFFRDVDMTSFDFIGDFDRLDEDLARLEHMLGVSGNRAWVNSNPHRGYGDEVRRLIGDTDIRAALVELLADDIAFFERHTAPPDRGFRCRADSVVPG